MNQLCSAHIKSTTEETESVNERNKEMSDAKEKVQPNQNYLRGKASSG